MQNKGAIMLFAIAFALVCLFQISFTIVTRNVEKKATKYASNEEAEFLAQTAAQVELSTSLFDKDFSLLSETEKNSVLTNPNFEILKKIKLQTIINQRRSSYLDSISREVVYNIGIRKYTFKECKEREINLGLDLKGGMNVTMEISVSDILIAMSGNSTDVAFNQAIARALEMQKTSNDHFVTLFGKAFSEIDPNAKLSSPALFGKAEYKDRINLNTTNEEVLAILRSEADAAVDRTYNILRTRIDRFGVAQPNIQKLQTDNRILIELPGIKEPERVRKLLQGTAKLEFWETYENALVYNYLSEANDRLKDTYIDSTDTVNTETLVDSLDILASETTDAVAVNDTALIESNDTSMSMLDQLAGDSTNPIDSLGEQEKFKKDNPLFTLLQPSFVQDEEGNYYPGQGPVVGYANIKDTAKINNMLSLTYIKALFPSDLKFLWIVKPIDKEETTLQLIGIKVNSRDGSAPLTGDVIVDARQDYDQGGKPDVLMVMNSEGARTWKRLTGDNVGKSIAIVLDDYVYSFPTVQAEISGGRSSISGNFTIPEAQDLANILKAGALPAPARIVEEAIVGPSLGKEAIRAGLISFIIAFLLVLIYMVFYYNKAGMVANIALLTNVFFIFGVLASLGAVLTLPGIAGIVLTMGMAVDANVIIYERIIEELRAGKGLRLAITDGYNNAYSAIIDGNVTTLLTAVVLFIFGTGPVQGFATTLIIGILCSLFTSIFISRIIFTWLLDKNKRITFDNVITRNAFSNWKIKFLSLRKTFYIISGIIILLGITSLVVRKLSYGVDFAGGRSYVIRFDKDVATQDVRSKLVAEFGEAPEVKTFGSNNQIKLTTKFMIDDNSETADSVVEKRIFDAIAGTFATPITFQEFTSDDENKLIGRLSSQKVGPTVARDIKVAAIMSVFFALIIIFAYIALRFKRWQFGLAGLIALAHDTIIVISVYSIFYNILPFNLEVDQTFIAAILTVIGYSINDTVIVFDRIRENMALYPKRELENNINISLNSVMGRTINTSGTTLIVLLTIFIFGGDVIRGFAFSLFIGIAIGTYSSMFIATPIVFDLMKNKIFKK
ncbi:MAG: protein translocase subunit SecDF [Bacteroidales bacterium]|nr:protein translocase subunit SecDF [Bacteroidales bacterium]